MKKIILLFFAVMAIAFPMRAQDPEPKPSTTPIILETHPIDPIPNPKPHRAPMRIYVEAYYEDLSGMISIVYDGEAEGEVNLYRDGMLIDRSSEINTSFSVSGNGLYTIEINTGYWRATGNIEI